MGKVTVQSDLLYLSKIKMRIFSKFSIWKTETRRGDHLIIVKNVSMFCINTVLKTKDSDHWIPWSFLPKKNLPKLQTLPAGTSRGEPINASCLRRNLALTLPDSWRQYKTSRWRTDFTCNTSSPHQVSIHGHGHEWINNSEMLNDLYQVISYSVI